MEKTLKKKNFSILDILVSPEMSILIPLLVLCAFTSIKTESFLTLNNIQIILRNTSFIGALAIGQAFALMCGEIDLSVGTTASITTMVFAVALVNLKLGLVGAIIAALLTGALVGCINAFFTIVLHVNSWITTMSMQYICKGFATVITNGRIVKLNDWGDGISKFSKLKPLGLNWIFFIFLGFIVVGEIVIRYTPIGRKIHAVGLSVYAARVAGINVKKVKALCFITCSMMASVCGIFYDISTNTGSPTQGDGNDFPSIISCVVGGVSNMGGKGSMLGCLLGVVMYQTLKNCLQLLGANQNLQLILVGIILIFAVYVDVLKVKISQRTRKSK